MSVDEALEEIERVAGNLEEAGATPAQMLEFADRLLEMALGRADMAYSDAAGEGSPLPLRDGDPAAGKRVTRRVRARGKSEIEAAVGAARRMLGIALDATTADVEEALNRKDEFAAIREAIKYATMAARSAAGATSVPRLGSMMAAMAWLLAHATHIGREVVIQGQGGFEYGRRGGSQLARGVDLVLGVAPLQRKEALKLILAASDQRTNPHWHTVVEIACDRVKKRDG